MTAPPDSVISAFNLRGGPDATRLLDGGQGTSYLVDNAVLKPIDHIEETNEVMTLSKQLRILSSPWYRIPQPLEASSANAISSSRFVNSGWAAMEYFESTTNDPQGKWSQMLVASRAFHADLQRLVDSPPHYIAERTHRWARADRLLWERDQSELETQDVSPLIQIYFHRLIKLRGIVDHSQVPSQLIHGDLAGNFLFADDQPPAIIDLSLYWRPVEYAEAMMIADGLLYHGGGRALVGLVERSETRLQMLATALLFRLLVAWDCMRERGSNTEEVDELAGQLKRAIEIVEKAFDLD